MKTQASALVILAALAPPLCAAGPGWAELAGMLAAGPDAPALQDCGGAEKVKGVRVHRSDLKQVRADAGKQAACKRAQATRMTGRLPSADFDLAKLAATSAYTVQAPPLSTFLATYARAMPMRYGVEVATPGLRFARGIGSHGELSRLPDGRWLWRVEVHSPGALSIEFAFSKLFLPAGSELFVATPSGDVVRGPVRADMVQPDGRYYSPLVPGERAVLQVAMTPEVLEQVAVEVANIGHAYRPILEAARGLKSGACNVDVACPLGNAWGDQIDAVGQYTLRIDGSTAACTGTLVANTGGTPIPYFLTANHCLTTEAVADTVVVYWNYQSSTCRAPGSAASGTPLPRTVATHSQSGASLIATSSASDFTLLRLDAAVPTGANPYFAGWDNTGATPGVVTGIHHPAGEEKRISDSAQPLATASYLGAPGSGSTHWRVPDWDNGTTEGGSSGSALFNSDRRVIGNLHGGFAACGNNDSDYYGRLSVSWNGGGTAATRLRDHLDPAGTGATTLNGYRSSGGGGGGTSNPQDEPSIASITLPAPNPANASCPAGFFIATVTDGPGTGLTPGAFGMETLLLDPGSRLMQGGVNFGGLVDQSQVGFAGFNFTNPANENQRFNLSLTGSPASSSTGSLQVRVKIIRQTSATQSTTVYEATGNLTLATPSVASITVPPGFYVATVAVEGASAGSPGGAPEGQFFFSLTTSFVDRPGGGFQGGAVVGGYHAAHPFGGVSGFAAFCISTPHAASMRALSAPTYGPTGARDLRVQMLDANQAVIASQPTVGGGDGGGSNQLQNGVAVNASINSTTPNSDFDEYTVVIPAGASNLAITTSNATGDLDLYVRLGSPPTLETFDCRPFSAGGNESCTAATPTAGTYFVRVYGFATGNQTYTIRASWTP